MLSGLVGIIALFLGPALLPGGPLADVCPLFAAEQDRFGINVTSLYGKRISDYDAARVHVAWYLDYVTQENPLEPAGIEYVQTLSARGFDPVSAPVDVAAIGRLVAANPGSLWILGNEPDRADYQDSQPPDHYAVFYHDAYVAIKRRDPTARVAPAGIVQPTPLRLRYLDAVLDAYIARYGGRMPVDLWTVHNFILPEVAGDWGADIPPGMEAYADEGIPYELDDHDRLDIFAEQIVAFRRWMAARGYRDKPLILTEYGILMPPILGFDTPRVRAFMLGSFNYLRTAVDAGAGYPADGNRLVQAWAWYSLNDRVYDMTTGEGYNGNLFDHDSGAITPLGRSFSAYTAELADDYVDPIAVSAVVRPGIFLKPNEPNAVTVAVTVANGGTLAAEDLTVKLWLGDPDRGGRLLGSETIVVAAARCRATAQATFEWRTGALQPGSRTLVAEVSAGAMTDRRPGNNRAYARVVVLEPGQEVQTVHLPALSNLTFFGIE